MHEKGIIFPYSLLESNKLLLRFTVVSASAAVSALACFWSLPIAARLRKVNPLKLVICTPHTKLASHIRWGSGVFHVRE